MNYDFLTRLQNGESIQDIANDVTQSLNEANRQHIQEQEARCTREREEAIAREQDKRYYAETLVDDLYNLLEVYGIEFDIDEENDSVDMILRLMDNLAPVFKTFTNPKHPMNPEVGNKEDPIGDFLRLFVNK